MLYSLHLRQSCLFPAKLYNYLQGTLWKSIFFLFLILRPDFTSNLLQGLAFGTPKFYIAPYGKINHGLVNLSSNCDMKSGLRSVAQLKIKGAIEMLLYVALGPR